MPSSINKKTVERLAELARIDLTETEKEKLSSDMAKILGHFKELQKLDASHVQLAASGTYLKNVFRGDDERESTDKGAGVEAFPETQDGFLKIPPVFSVEGGSSPGANAPLKHATGGE